MSTDRRLFQPDPPESSPDLHESSPDPPESSPDPPESSRNSRLESSIRRTAADDGATLTFASPAAVAASAVGIIRRSDDRSAGLVHRPESVRSICAGRPPSSPSLCVVAICGSTAAADVARQAVRPSLRLDGTFLGGLGQPSQINCDVRVDRTVRLIHLIVCRWCQRKPPVCMHA